jgi:hypothetical protein
MRLATDLILILLIELPLVSYMFNKKRRGEAVLFAFLFNMVTWSTINIIFVSTEINTLPFQIPMIALEAYGFKRFLKKSWKKSIFISVIINISSLIVVYAFNAFVPDDILYFNNKKPIVQAMISLLF